MELIGMLEGWWKITLYLKALLARHYGKEENMKRYMFLYVLLISFILSGCTAVSTGETGITNSKYEETVINNNFQNPKQYGYLYPIEKDGGYAYINKKGEPILSNIPKEEGVPAIVYAVVQTPLGFYNYLGNTIKTEYNIISGGDSEGYVLVEHEGKYGYINLFGEVVIEPKYTELSSFSGDFATAKESEEGEMLVLNRMGDIVLKGKEQAIVKNASSHFDSYSLNNNGNKMSLNGFSKFGNGLRIAYTSKYPEMEWNLADYIYLDMFNRVAIDASKTDTFKLGTTLQNHIFSEGMACFKNDSGWGFINTAGDVIIPPIYKRTYPFRENKAVVVNEDNKFGVIDKVGKVIIDFKYDYIKSFSEGKAAFLKDGLYGFIDSNGTVLFDPQFLEVDYWLGDVCQVRFSDKRCGYINTAGDVLWKSQSIVDNRPIQFFSLVDDPHMNDVKDGVIPSK